MSDTADLLVEIGCEELPPKALAALAEDLRTQLVTRLLPRAAGGSLDLVDSADAAERFYGPRRIAVRVRGLRLQQPDSVESLSGPAEKVAFDAAGKPTKAALGFASKCGVAVEALGRKDGKLHFERKVAGRPAKDVLPEAVVAALDALHIPKRMRWGTSDLQFVRPVHWVVLLLGADVVDATVYGVRSGRETRGHRFHHPEPIALGSPADYERALKAAKVLVDDGAHSVEREILRQAEAQAAALGGTLLPSATRIGGLVSEVAALCEWPVVLEGGFDPDFLELPPEVLISTIESNQRYFLLAGKDGRLLPRFLFVANVESREPKVIVGGNERVIVPRLSDARFFWAQDRATSLAARTAGLAAVVFQKDLGSYADRAGRVATLARAIAERIGGDVAQAARAAELAKCDLLTSLVGEFPELQGTLGMHLARADGEPEPVAEAIEAQYLPRFAGDRLPATPVGQALALADKLDTLAGVFAIGQRPTGDKDPFALRRAALGAMRIVIEGKLDLDLKALIAQAYAPFPATKGHEDPATYREPALYTFMMERLRAGHDEAGRRADVFNAVLAVKPAKPLDFATRVAAVEVFLGLPEAAALAAANKRISNILRQAGADAVAKRVDAALLSEPGEQALHEALTGGEVAWVEGLLEQGAYDSALKRLAGLKAPVDAFFDGVMVMADDPKVRANRLALLAQLQALFLRVADLAEIQTE